MRQVWSGKSDETADGTVIDLDLEAQHPHYLQAGRIRQLVDQHWNLHSGPSG
jgi:HSP90 family molecular chaperone